MCGRYVAPDVGDMERYWQLTHRESSSSLFRRYNVAPTVQVPIILRNETEGGYTLLDARWGLIPFWWKQDKLPPMTFNARSEEAATKPMWRDALKSKRCLMPALGWYEWNEKEQVRSLTGKLVNQPNYHYSPNSEVIAIAGLWSVWNRPDAHPILSCALMTKDAAPCVAPVHHRMPIILRPDQYDAWLDPMTSTNDILAIIQQPRDDFEFYKVSTAVNNARKDSPDMIQPMEAA